MAVEEIQLSRPDVVVLDIPAPHRGGIQGLREIRRKTPSAIIITFTADPSVVLQEVCLEAGANYYLHKTQLRELIDICSDRLVRSGTASNW
jgi:DNA-binding response OmpR family regulator